MKGSNLPLLDMILAMWLLACGTFTAYFWMQIEKDAARFMLIYFQPVVPALLLLWLWAHIVKSFESLQIEYDACFNAKDRKLLLTGAEIKKIALVLISIVMAWAALFAWTSACKLYFVTEVIPLALYASLVFILLFPLNVMHRPTRFFFLSTVKRVMLPLQHVTWADFLLADMLTSLAKSSGDVVQATCSIATGPSLRHLSAPNAPNVLPALCSPLSTLSVTAVCLPYLLRFVQCILVYRSTGKTAQVFNALKYCSSIPALVLTLWEHECHVHGKPFPYFWPWLCASTFNTAFSFYWDVEQDWDMPWIFTSGVPARPIPSSLLPPGTASPRLRKVVMRLRQLLPAVKSGSLFGSRWYVWLVCSNLVLRLSWIHRLLGNLEAMSAVALTVAVLEVYRRYQWAFVRIETELRKLKAKTGSQMTLSVHSSEDEGYPSTNI
ncbi:hypothetical protein CEUSTIGMA_g9847.t1 [Chlamydomonas eustigma]|uniref:EXS domain-containing protein n=1 Tax=Chlamydomonas eustigma TaxID=1157962 RepID=A0A250XHM2_9CHLO|nr:hypothetical protein CEUSTIGMA_g9847.t1 [Chlamydomonas eustigma]|eukprot:GAX82419.1 hypothetical protein CEUSTIGMA_g9847.t1 [Chlamydomonas eustigma]